MVSKTLKFAPICFLY